MQTFCLFVAYCRIFQMLAESLSFVLLKTLFSSQSSSLLNVSLKILTQSYLKIVQFLLSYNLLKYLMKKGTSANNNPPPAASKVAPQQQKGKAPPTNKPFNADDYVSLTLPREEVVDIRQAFEIFDSDGSGIMDPAELKQAFIDLGFTGQNKFVYQILAELDEDQSGGIDFPEFLRLATAKIGEKDNRAEINKVFNAFDPNRSGKFTTLELKKVAQDLGEDLTDDEIQHMFTKADLDDDGFVTAEDFYNIMTHRVYWDGMGK